MAGNEFILGYTPDGICEIVMSPVRGPVTAFRARSPPPPPPPPPCGPRSPSPPSRPPSSGGRNFSIPTSDGNLIEGTISPVFTNLKVTIDTTSGRRSVKRKKKVRRIPPPRPPPPRTPPSAAAGAPPPRPPPPQRRWISPPPAVIQDDPPPYPGGIEVREVTPPPAYGEVVLRQNEDIVEMITRTSGGLYPLVSTPPAAAEAEPSAPPLEQARRGVVRPHSISPFVRNTKPCLDTNDKDDDLEAVATLLDFVSKKERSMVKTFCTEEDSTPRTPAPAPRPEIPPPIITGRLLNTEVARPRAVRRIPSAALGAPPREESEDEIELPDLPSPATSDVTVHSTVSSPWVYTGYSSDEDDIMKEYEYMDPYEDEGPWSSTPPPPCDTPDHEVCVPPAWGERIPGSPVRCKCVLCHEEERHHPVRCIQCGNAPGCCQCLWDYMRSRYNSGCPLCRAGDPGDDDPLAPDQPRATPMQRGDVAPPVGGVTATVNPRTRRGRAIAATATLLCGIGRARGRGRPQPQERTMTAISRRGRGRGRRGRGVTTEDEQPER